MSITVTVEATWRLSRVEFNTPYNLPGNVIGYGEVLLEQSGAVSPELLGGRPRIVEEEPATYGAMPGAAVKRVLHEVMEDTIDIDGTEVKFSAVMGALQMFFEKWRIDDQEGHPVIDPRLPVAAPLTPMPPVPLNSEPPPDWKDREGNANGRSG